MYADIVNLHANNSMEQVYSIPWTCLFSTKKILKNKNYWIIKGRCSKIILLDEMYQNREHDTKCILDDRKTTLPQLGK